MVSYIFDEHSEAIDHYQNAVIVCAQKKIV